MPPLARHNDVAHGIEHGDVLAFGFERVDFRSEVFRGRYVGELVVLVEFHLLAQDFLDLGAVFELRHHLAVDIYLGSPCGGEAVGPQVHVGRGEAEVGGNVAGDVAPYLVDIDAGLLAVGLAHVGAEERLYGAFECTHFHNLHLHAELIHKPFVEHYHGLQAVDVDFADGVKVNFV